MKRYVIAGFMAAILFAVGHVVWASIPDANRLFHACYSTSGNPNTRGLLRIVDFEAGETCGSDESAVSWNQTDRPTYSKNATFSFPASRSHSEILKCDLGDIVTGGGFRMHTSTPSIRVEESHQTLSLDGWVLTIQNDLASPTTAESFVICKDSSF